MEQQLLLRSSNNLSEMIKLLKIHEETLSRVTRIRATTDNQIVDLFNVVITNENIRLNNANNANNTNRNNNTDNHVFDNDLFLETTYSEIIGPIHNSCPITREDFLENDNVIMIRECRHIFKKTAFQTWIQNNNTCPCCRITIQ
jgi:hypothetical protein